MGLGEIDYKSIDNKGKVASGEPAASLGLWRTVLRKIWPIVAVGAIFNTLHCEQGDLGGSMWRSVIECPDPTPVDGMCPIGAYVFTATGADAVCLPVAKSSSHWSGSAHCMDFNHVMRRTSQMQSYLIPFMGACACIGPLCGLTFIDKWGRKFIMLITIVTAAMVVFAHLALISAGLNSFTYGLVVAIQLLACFTSLYSIAQFAMLADAVSSDNTQKGIAFSISSAITSVSTLLAFCIAYLILGANLEDYKFCYVLFLVASIALFFFALYVLPESGPSSAAEKRGLRADQGAASRSDESDGIDEFSLKGFWKSRFEVPMRYILSDTWLSMMTVMVAFEQFVQQGLNFVCAPWSMMILGFSQSTASTTAILQNVFMIIGSVASAHVASKKLVNVYVMYYTGCFVVALGYFIASLSPVFPGYGASLFRLGWGVITGVGYGIAGPGISTIIATRLTSQYYGSVFAILGFFMTLGIAGGATLASSTILPATIGTHGWKAATVFWAGALIYGVCTLIKVLVHYFKIRPEDERAAAAMASAKTTDAA